MSLRCHLQQADHVLAQRSRKERVFCCALQHSWESCSPFIDFQSSRKRMSFFCCALQNSWKSCGPFMNFQRKVCEYAPKQVRCFFPRCVRLCTAEWWWKLCASQREVRILESVLCTSVHIWKASQARTKAETKKAEKKNVQHIIDLKKLRQALQSCSMTWMKRILNAHWDHNDKAHTSVWK